MRHYEKKDGILKSTSYVMLILIFVKLIGFVKQAVIAAYFGTSLDMDLYLIASDFISETGIVFFSSLSVSFLTMFVKQKEEKGKREADIFLFNTMVSFVLVAFGVIALVWIFAQPITSFIASGYDESQRSVVGGYIKIISVVIINICIGNICTAALEGEKVFLPGKLIGIIQSVCVIAACVFGAERNGIYALLYGLIVYYIIQNVFLLYFVFRNNKLCIGRFWKDRRVLEIIRLCIPLFISNAVVQINVMIDKSIASHMPEGSVTALSYSHYLFSTIHSIMIGSFCTVIFSYFSGYVAAKEQGKIIGELKKGIANLLLLLLPLTVICIVNAEEIVRLVYARGVFGEESVKVTAYALIGYALGIIFIALRDLLIRVHYAFQDTKTPMLNGIIGVGVNVTLSVILARYCGVFGVAVADSVSYFLVLLLVIHSVKRYLKDFQMFQSNKIPVQLALAVIAGAAAGYFSKYCLLYANYIIRAIINGTVILTVFFGSLLVMKCTLVLEWKQKICSKISGRREM